MSQRTLKTGMCLVRPSFSPSSVCGSKSSAATKTSRPRSMSPRCLAMPAQLGRRRISCTWRRCPCRWKQPRAWTKFSDSAPSAVRVCGSARTAPCRRARALAFPTDASRHLHPHSHAPSSRFWTETGTKGRDVHTMRGKEKMTALLYPDLISKQVPAEFGTSASLLPGLLSATCGRSVYV